MAKVLTHVRSSFPVPLPMPDAGQEPPLPQFVRPPDPPIVGSIDGAKNLLNHLRQVRDNKAFQADGAHNFREWTMKQFGDRIGIWLDEML